VHCKSAHVHAAEGVLSCGGRPLARTVDCRIKTLYSAQARHMRPPRARLAARCMPVHHKGHLLHHVVCQGSCMLLPSGAEGTLWQPVVAHHQHIPARIAHEAAAHQFGMSLRLNARCIVTNFKHVAVLQRHELSGDSRGPLEACKLKLRWCSAFRWQIPYLRYGTGCSTRGCRWGGLRSTLLSSHPGSA
jgi:hypothetical protein